MHVSDADIEQRSDQADKQHAGISPDDPEYVDIVKSFLQHAGKWNRCNFLNAKRLQRKTFIQLMEEKSVLFVNPLTFCSVVDRNDEQ